MAELNGKIVFTADTRKFDEGAKKVRKGVKDLEGVSKSALGSIGDAFGVNTGKVGQMSSALVGLGDKLKNCGSTGGQAIGKLITGFGSLGAAIGGIGITGAIAAFKQLDKAAQNFSTTMDGLNLKMSAKQWTDTYTQAMYDATQGTSRWLYQMGNNAKKIFTTVGSYTGTLIGSGFNFSETNQAQRQARYNANEAGYAAGQMAEYQKQQVANSVIIAKNEAKIAEYTRIARDATASTVERSEAKRQAEELITRNFEIQYDLAKKMSETQSYINSLSSNTLEDTQKEAGLKIAVSNLEKEREQRLASLERYTRSIEGGTKATKQAISEMLPDLSAASREISNSIIGGAPNLSRVDTTLIAGTLAAQNKAVVQIPAKIVPMVDKEQVQRAVVDMVPVIEESFSIVGDALGGLIGDLATGGDAWSNFGNAALSAMGDMAVQVGRMAVGAGVATLGIKKALESLNGYAAIAAGTALIALGAAVKTGLSNIASGGYSAGTSSAVASSGYTSTPGSFERSMTVNVVGKLEADGNKLIAVIGNETNRRNISA